MAHIVIDARLIHTTTGRYIERLLTYIEKEDKTNHYTVLVPHKDRDYWQPTQDNLKVVEADFKQYSFAEQVGLLRLLNKLRPDLVHFCMPQQPIRYKGKHVTTFHDLILVETYNSDKNWLVYHAKQFVGAFAFRRIARTSDHIITPSQFTKDGLVDFAKIDSSKITVTYEGADIYEGESTPYDELINAHYLLYVGQQKDYKNIRRLIIAHQQLRARHPELLLVLVGSLNASAIANQQWVKNHDYQGVLFTGFVDDSTLAWLYQHTRAYVFPSLMEGFGLPGLEAMSYGAPVASSSATCLPEVYGDGAIYFDPFNIDDIAAVVERYLTDVTLRASQIQKGTVQFKKYSWQRMAEQTLEVYKKALKN